MADRGLRAAERSPEEIRYEIERTRSHLDETVEAIGDRLSPGRFVDELWMRVQSEGASAVTHTLRQHPIPFTLVGAGLSWLVYERAKGRPRRPLAGQDMRQGARDGAAGTVSRAGESMREASSRLKHSATDAAHAVSEAGHAVGEKAAAATGAVTTKLSDAASTAKESVSDAAETAARGMKQGAERAREGFWEMLDRNPMAVAALALGIGMASGLSAPRTRWEDERLGRFARPLREDAKQVVEETAEKAKGVAQEALQAAGRTAVDTARERARAEGLTAEGMKETATRVHERGRERGES